MEFMYVAWNIKFFQHVFWLDSSTFQKHHLYRRLNSHSPHQVQASILVPSASLISVWVNTVLLYGSFTTNLDKWEFLSFFKKILSCSQPGGLPDEHLASACLGFIEKILLEWLDLEFLDAELVCLVNFDTSIQRDLLASLCFVRPSECSWAFTVVAVNLLTLVILCSLT